MCMCLCFSQRNLFCGHDYNVFLFQFSQDWSRGLMLLSYPLDHLGYKAVERDFTSQGQYSLGAMERNMPSSLVPLWFWPTDSLATGVVIRSLQWYLLFV